MARVKAQRFRRGGRNSAFFPQLSGLQRALDRVTEVIPEPAKDFSAEKLAEAEAKRQRKMNKARKNVNGD